ncbi:MAG: thioredoxin family protein [Emcibacteraceae bacterium]|nr:thioredoxin family protein [Emcibacteraceae bacterium]
MKIFRSIVMLVITLISSVSIGNAQQTSNEMLLGVITSADLQKAPYESWYNKENDDYEVDETSLENLKTLMKGVDVKIIMGTWCHDSKREVPRFYKMLSVSGVSEKQVEMIALDRKKMAPNGEIDNMEITNTPTFIFYKNGQELNRIVEKPVESLEKDLVKVLKKQPYRHSKMPK